MTCGGVFLGRHVGISSSENEITRGKKRMMDCTISLGAEIDLSKGLLSCRVRTRGYRRLCHPDANERTTSWMRFATNDTESTAIDALPHTQHERHPRKDNKSNSPC